MKIKTHGRFIMVLALILVLTSQAAGVVSAASVSWTSGSNHYTATVNRTGNSLDQSLSVPSTTTAHTYGIPTTIRVSTARTLSAAWSGAAFPSAYVSYLTQAMHQASLYETAMYTVAAGTTATIPSGAATGTYTLAVKFNYYSAAWSVVIQSTARSANPAANNPSGQIARAYTRTGFALMLIKV